MKALVICLAFSCVVPLFAAARSVAFDPTAHSVAAQTALVRCRRASMRWLDRYRRGVVGCFTNASLTSDPSSIVACRRAYLMRFESRMAHIEMDARRRSVTCAAPELSAAAARRTWLADLMEDILAPASQCGATRLRALGRFVGAAGHCIAEQLATGDSTAVGACISEAVARFSDAWTADDTEPCDAPPLAEVIARVLDGLWLDAADHSAECGNGHIEGVEECDDRNTRDGDGCDASCRRESCATVSPGELRVCRFCGPNAAVNAAGECACNAGYEPDGDGCADVDECATGASACPAGSECVNVPGAYACAFECTQHGLENAIATCGGPAHAATFACRDRHIEVTNDGGWGNRRVRCDGLTIDGLDRNVTFELDPPCFDVAGSACPDVDDGAGFLLLEGNGITVRNLTVRWFFDGIQSRGRDNTVENVTFARQCDDSVTNGESGVGTLFRNLVIKDGCDKCAQSFGDPALTSDDAGARDHYNAIFESVDFIGCAQPLRMTDRGRFLVDDAHMFARRNSPFACRGPFFSSPDPDSLFVIMTDSIVTRCRRGVRFGGSATGLLDGNLIEKSALAGVRLGRFARVSLSGNRILSNGGRITTDLRVAGVVVGDEAIADLGGGSLEIDGAGIQSPGHNLLCGNTGGDDAPLELDASGMTRAVEQTWAAHNWWCESDPTQVIAGSIEFSPFSDFPR